MKPPEHRHRSRIVGLAVPILALLCLVGVAGCSGSDQPDAAESDGDPTAPVVEASSATDGRDNARREVRLALTDWTGSRINVAIAERLIERNLGYPVTPTPVGDIGSMLNDLASGELDAVLEIWPSSLSDRERTYFDDARVDDLGPLGVDGEVGWYVPRYVIDEDPTLKTWEGFARPEVARQFSSIGSGGRGRFVGTDPSYDQYDEDIVDSLDLNFEVVFTGSEEATRSELEVAVASQRPILLYWWRPTAEVVEFDLVKIELPARTAECLDEYRNGSAMACGYPVDKLFKAANPGLGADGDADLRRLLTAFTLDSDEQQEMIWSVEVEGQSISSVADRWVDENESKWRRWVS